MERDEFREGTFKRDGHKCVICKKPAKDAHHIMERRLFPTEGPLAYGYTLDNGASLCEEHHVQAEQTVLSCEEIRQAAGIEKVILPDHLYPDTIYDKWGNAFLGNGLRSRGELFEDESVQKILPEHVKQSISKYVKYPRTYHLPWSPGLLDDDRKMSSTENFAGKQIVVTVKMDGENTTMYDDYLHARSVTSDADLSRHWVKNLQSQKGWEIPAGWRICGENLYARHSIAYDALDTYFMVFSIWNEKNVCLSWEETREYSELLGLKVVPVLYEGIYDEAKLKTLYTPKHGDSEMEGYVVRLATSFHYKDFRKSVGKYVRKDHVKTNEHWKRTWVPNKLIK
jgi:hypothetical protein